MFITTDNLEDVTVLDSVITSYYTRVRGSNDPREISGKMAYLEISSLDPILGSDWSK